MTIRDSDRRLSIFEKSLTSGDDADFSPIFIMKWGKRYTTEQQEKAFDTCVTDAKKEGYTAGVLLVTLD